MVRNLPLKQETWVQSLGWEDPLEEEWQPTLVFLPGNSYGQWTWQVCGVAKSWTWLSNFHMLQFSSVQSLSRIWLCDPMKRSTPGLPVHHQLPEFTQTQSIESVMPSNHLILCRPLLLLPSILPSIRVFSNESTLCIRWPKYWSFSFSISPSNEHPGLIFRMDWLDLLAVPGTLKSLLQHHSSKASIFQCSAFLTVQFSHPYMTLEKP